MNAYGEFGQAAAAVLRGGQALYPTATATTVRVRGGKGGDVVTSDGPYAETKESAALIAATSLGSDDTSCADPRRLIFTCCHPCLGLEAQVALALRTLGGLSTPEAARALLVPEATMAKRLTRAKPKVAPAPIPCRVPDDDQLPQRLAGVATTVYLIVNEGYASGAGDD